MERAMISYSLSGRRDALTLTRKIYGYRDSSNHSKYSYDRKGILSDIQYEKVARATFLIDKKHKETIIKELRDLGLKLKVYDVDIKGEKTFKPTKEG